MKKCLVMIFLNLLFISTCFSQSIDIVNSISGTYLYESNSNTEYEIIIEKDSTIKSIPHHTQDNCCSEKWTLKLNNDFTFSLKFYSDQGDYSSSCISNGNYIIHEDTLFLFSCLPINTGIMEPVNAKIPESLFKISFKGDSYNNAQIARFIDSHSFYTLDSQYFRKKINWTYSVPDRSLLNDYEDSNIDTISFVFKRKDIDNYFLSIIEINSEVRSSHLLKMSDYKHNNYYVTYEKFSDTLDGDKHERFIDVSTFKFIIKQNELVSVDKHSNEIGELVFFRFRKMK